jgi:hypothetical protein
MIKKLSNSYTAAQNISAKKALNELRTSDHSLGRPLALCLMFETAENQLLAASVFNLAIMLDAALHIPNESLLAAIRIQWWADTLASTADQNLALVARLQSQYQVRNHFFIQLQEMIGEWQAACHDESQDSGAGWAAAFRLTAIQLGNRTAADQAAIIGQSLYHLTRGQRYDRRAGNIDIKPFRQNNQKEGQRWLYFLACLQRKLYLSQNSDLKTTQTQDDVGLDDPVLVWRILGWYIFGPPR